LDGRIRPLRVAEGCEEQFSVSETEFDGESFMPETEKILKRLVKLHEDYSRLAEPVHHRDTENAEEAQRTRQI
jgi:hypothetical protein